MTVSRQTFQKCERLGKTEEITLVLRNGLRFGGKGLSVIYLKNGRSQKVRAGFIVRKKLGGAVVRNQMKRRMRETYRRIKAGILPGTDLVLSANRVMDQRAVTESIISALGQAGLTVPAGKNR